MMGASEAGEPAIFADLEGGFEPAKEPVDGLADQRPGLGAVPGERPRKAVSRSLGPAVAATATGAANSGWRPVRGTSTGAMASRPVARACGIGQTRVQRPGQPGQHRIQQLPRIGLGQALHHELWQPGHVLARDPRREHQAHRVGRQPPRSEPQRLRPWRRHRLPRQGGTGRSRGVRPARPERSYGLPARRHQRPPVSLPLRASAPGDRSGRVRGASGRGG